MKRGFYTIIAAQFFSSLADNALLIAAIALLAEQHAPPWMTPVLKLFFVLSYVVLAAFVGAFADAFPKGRVMFGTNLIKVVGCLAMLAGTPPLISYGIVGLGAAAYSPAKYGILTELLPPDRLVAANGWMEGTTVLSIVLGTVCGGILISPHIMHHLLHRALPFADHASRLAILFITAIYAIAALFNLRIPDTGVRYPPQQHGPIRLVQDFANCFTVLWKDRIGQISLAVTTLLWGAAQTLQFIVLQWAQHSLGLSLSQASVLQAFVAIGVAIGAVVAAAKIPLRRALNTLPVGLAIGGSILLMAFFQCTGLHCHSMRVPCVHRRAIRVLCGADERRASAPRPRPAFRRALDRRAELQRKSVHPCDLVPVYGTGVVSRLHYDDHCDFQFVRDRRDDVDHAATSRESVAR
jgi:LPLT family lysophospholipid transporter-like MFS transporter